jgi:hypothetical protein
MRFYSLIYLFASSTKLYVCKIFHTSDNFCLSLNCFLGDWWVSQWWNWWTHIIIKKNWEFKDIPTINKFNKIVFLHEHFEYQEFDLTMGMQVQRCINCMNKIASPQPWALWTFDITFFSAQYWNFPKGSNFKYLFSFYH